MKNVQYFSYLSTLFSPRILGEIANYDFSSFSRVLHETNFESKIQSTDTLNVIFDKVFDFLTKHYCNEYVYKNSIANDILLKHHRWDASCLLNELRVEDSKADIVILNGTSSVYEIKTELDSFDRLDKQLRAYLKVFDRVHVVTHPTSSQKLLEDLPQNVGLIELTNKNHLKTVKKHVSNKANVHPSAIFNLFRKNEYTKVLRKFCNINLSGIPNTKIYDVAKQRFEKLPPVDAHKFMLNELRKRKMHNLEHVDDVPKSLILNFLITKFDERARISLFNNLQKTYF